MVLKNISPGYGVQASLMLFFCPCFHYLLKYVSILCCFPTVSITQWSEVNLANTTTSDNFVYESGDNCYVAIVVGKAVSHLSPDFNAFIAISLRKTAMFLFTGNHFLFVGLFD